MNWRFFIVFRGIVNSSKFCNLSKTKKLYKPKKSQSNVDSFPQASKLLSFKMARLK